jgi:hypothetical protein
MGMANISSIMLNGAVSQSDGSIIDSCEGLNTVDRGNTQVGKR